MTFNAVCTPASRWTIGQLNLRLNGLSWSCETCTNSWASVVLATWTAGFELFSTTTGLPETRNITRFRRVSSPWNNDAVHKIRNGKYPVRQSTFHLILLAYTNSFSPIARRCSSESLKRHQIVEGSSFPASSERIGIPLADINSAVRRYVGYIQIICEQ